MQSQLLHCLLVATMETECLAIQILDLQFGASSRMKIRIFLYILQQHMVVLKLLGSLQLVKQSQQVKMELIYIRFAAEKPQFY